MNRITESTVNGILDRRLLNEAGGGLEVDVSTASRSTTNIGTISADGTTVSGGVAGLGGDPSPRINYRPPVIDRIDVPGLNQRFWDWFKRYHKGEDEYEG